MERRARSAAPASRRSRRRRRLAVGAAVLTTGVAGLWSAIHHVPGFGPALANGARAVVGPAAVAWAEDVAYGIEDRVNRLVYRSSKPKTFWTAPAGATAAPAPQAEAASAPAAGEHAASFPPAPYEPPFANVAGEGDGQWVPIQSPGAPDGPVAMVKTVVHPDPKRTFAAVAVVAIDLRRLDLKLVAGTQEPFSITVKPEERSGKIAPDDAADLVAAFNGGFRAEHGHYGMMLDGKTFLAPRDIACTVALYRDGRMRIRTWTEVKATEGEMHGYRQTPPCLVEQGDTNKALSIEYNRSWGATVSGETVIRRSAIGLDATGRTLFYGLGEAVTAQSLARGMKAVGAVDAAQLDVNYAYPRFLFYDHPANGAPPKATSALIPDVKFVSTEYATEPSPRDFFYLVRRRDAS